jgi:multidrug efflux pump subunit AcrB
MLTRLALRARVLTIIVTIAVIVAGVFSASRLQVELLPDVDFPLITVATVYPGADPQTVLANVTQPVEQAVQGLNGLATVRSTTSPNVSLVIAQFDFGTDMKAVERTVAGRLKALALPPGAQPPRLARLNLDEFPVLELSALGQTDINALHAVLSTQVLPAVRAVPGVYSAELPLGAEAGTSITRTNGAPSLSISVVKEPDANTVEVVEGVMAKLDEVKPSLPAGITFVTIANQAPDIQNSVNTLLRELLLGGILAVLVIFAFLLSVRPTLVSGVSIPVSLLAGLIIMGVQGMSLNIITLGGLAIAVGRVVDDSIVVMENIFRHLQRGEERMQAALNATREVAGAIISSTLTTIAVFVPLGFMGGIIGTFFRPFAVTVTYALLASLVVALAVVPVLSTYILSRTMRIKEKETLLQRVYTPIVRWALGHKKSTIAAAVVLFIGSLALVPLIPISFLPSSQLKVVSARVNYPRGTAPPSLQQGMADVETTLERFRKDGEVTTYQVTLGQGNGFTSVFSVAGATTIDALVVLSEDATAEAVAESLRAELKVEGADVTVSLAQVSGPQANTMQLRVLGNDPQELTPAALSLVASLQQLPGLINVTSDAPEPGAPGDSLISRVNGRRSVIISGTITEQNTQRVNMEVQRVIAAAKLPASITVESGGVFRDIGETFRQMGIAMAISVVLVFAVMVITMRSFASPFVIVFSLPLASIGALGALAITQRSLGLPALMGILMLIGLVVTNAIVLVVFVEQLRQQGRTMRDALIEAVRTRLRPILMTAFTTIFALMPLAVLPGESSGIIGAELATVVIGGLITSTFLTLVVIPVVYNLVRRERRQGALAEPAPAQTPT